MFAEPSPSVFVIVIFLKLFRLRQAAFTAACFPFATTCTFTTLGLTHLESVVVLSNIVQFWNELLCG